MPGRPPRLDDDPVKRMVAVAVRRALVTGPDRPDLTGHARRGQVG